MYLIDSNKNLRSSELFIGRSSPLSFLTFWSESIPTIKTCPRDLAYLNRPDTTEDPNPYSCNSTDGCLAKSYDAYDKLVGQRYRSDDFLSEQGLKKSIGLQSLPAYSTYSSSGYDFDHGTGEFVRYEDNEKAEQG